MSDHRAAVTSRISHLGADPSSGAGAWWDRLPADFHRHAESFELDDADRWPVRMTAATDAALRTFAGALLAGTALPLGYAPWSLPALHADRELYGRLVDAGDREAFFRAPPAGVVIDRRVARRPRFRPRDGETLDLSFESPFRPVNERLVPTFERHRRNRRAHARWWRHRGGKPRPTIIAVHGFSADLYLVNEWFFALPWLFRMGCDVVLATLPFHGPRQSALSPFSGHGFFAGGLGRMNEAFAQSVTDLRVLVRHLLDEEGVPEVGVTGVSLGGYVSGLLAATEPRLSFAIPNVPVASLPDLVLEWEPMGTAVRGLMKVGGLSLVDVRRACAVSCPLTWSPVLPRQRRMLIGGVADRLAPPKHTRLLWEHWDRCAVHWFPGSHLLHLDRGEYLWQITRFLRSIGFLDPDHPGPPERAAGP